MRGVSSRGAETSRSPWMTSERTRSSVSSRRKSVEVIARLHSMTAFIEQRNINPRIQSFISGDVSSTKKGRALFEPPGEVAQQHLGAQVLEHRRVDALRIVVRLSREGRARRGQEDEAREAAGAVAGDVAHQLAPLPRALPGGPGAAPHP